MDVRRNTRIAECSDQDGIEIAGQSGEPIGRDGHLIGEITIGSPVKRSELHRRTRGLDGLYRLGDYFFPDAVSGNYGDAFIWAHARRTYQIQKQINTATLLVHGTLGRLSTPAGTKTIASE